MSIPSQVRRVATLLKRKNVKVVFAESCTAGLVSASLARVPGISEHHCGGMVVYRNETKRAYLGIPASLLKSPGPVSEAVAREMALRVLKLTPEADVSASVTGHLGPGAPEELDGVVFIAVTLRRTSASKPLSKVFRYQCRSTDRVARQKEVVGEVLAQLSGVLESL